MNYFLILCNKPAPGVIIRTVQMFPVWESGDQKGRSHTLLSSRAQQGGIKISLLSWQGLSQWKAMGSWFTIWFTPNFLFLSIKAASFPCCGELVCDFPDCRPWIAILCWSQINPSLLEKYLAVYLFQIIDHYIQLLLLHHHQDFQANF